MPEAMNSMLTPILALVVWTFLIWLLMYATRIPAMQKARIRAGAIKRADELDVLPPRVVWIADNYNHLHEQPTVFYALAVYTHLAGQSDPVNVGLAWAYVGMRVVHSVVQTTTNYVPARFAVFALSSVLLMVITARNVWALLAAG